MFLFNFSVDLVSSAEEEEVSRSTNCREDVGLCGVVCDGLL